MFFTVLVCIFYFFYSIMETRNTQKGVGVFWRWKFLGGVGSVIPLTTCQIFLLLPFIFYFLIIILSYKRKKTLLKLDITSIATEYARNDSIIKPHPLFLRRMCKFSCTQIPSSASRKHPFLSIISLEYQNPKELMVAD